MSEPQNVLFPLKSPLSMSTVLTRYHWQIHWSNLTLLSESYFQLKEKCAYGWTDWNASWVFFEAVKFTSKQDMQKLWMSSFGFNATFTLFKHGYKFKVFSFTLISLLWSDFLAKSSRMGDTVMLLINNFDKDKKISQQLLMGNVVQTFMAPRGWFLMTLAQLKGGYPLQSTGAQKFLKAHKWW